MPSPVELRSAVAESRRDAVQNALAASSGEDSQTAVMRSRLEQQSELILMMKQHNEECKAETSRLRTELQNALGTESDTRTEILDARSELAQLRSRFDTLASNHEDIIKLKDGYKSEAAKLRSRVKILEAEAGGAVAAAAAASEAALAPVRAELKELRARHET
eukprot:UC1_evm1s360